MANIGFGASTNEKAQEMGYDMYETSLGETLGAVAKDAWNFNPVSSIIRYFELQDIRGQATNKPYIPAEELNEKYSKEGLFFYEDEKQDVVDLLLERKLAERKRQSIIQRGPQDNLSGALKFGASFVASAVDPINIAVSFIPVVGQARFASMVARSGFTRARFYKGLTEGFVGAAAVEPLVYGVAQTEQADYDLTDSFMAVSFGTVLGGGLHVGAGKLKDFNTRRKFEQRIDEARSKAGVENAEKAEVNLYKEYYPENSEIMKALAKTDPETRNILLSKALEDMSFGRKVDVTDVAKADPQLRKALVNENLPENERVDTSKPDNDIKIKNTEPTRQGPTKDDYQQELDVFESQRSLESQEVDLDIDINNKILELDNLKQKQKDYGIDDEVKIESVSKEIEEINTKSKEIKDTILNGINCLNGK